MSGENRPDRNPEAKARPFWKALAIGMAISAASMVLLDLLGIVDLFRDWP